MPFHPHPALNSGKIERGHHDRRLRCGHPGRYDPGTGGGAIAAREGARVALVESPGEVAAQVERHLSLAILAQASQDTLNRQSKGQTGPAAPEPDVWARLGEQIQACAAVAYPHLGLEGLAASGVDVVMGQGQFSPKPRLALSTPERLLRGRVFLLCPDTRLMVPAIPGLAQVPYLTLDRLLQEPVQPPDLAILGRSSAAIACQAALLGSRVTLVSRGRSLLPTEDEDISTLVESLLQAAGVTLHLGVQIEAIHHRDQVEIYSSDGFLFKAGQLLLATARHPQVAGLNLRGIGVKGDRTGLAVDDRLTTTHPRVFACGPALGGYWAETTDHQDVTTALHNSLYLPRRQIGHLHRLGLLHTAPEFARLGLTATQAQQGYGPAVWVFQVPFSQVIKPHLLGDVTGICRWVVHRDGRLLGTQICGPGASELIQTMALLMQQDIRISQLEKLAGLPQSLTAILHEMRQPGSSDAGKQAPGDGMGPKTGSTGDDLGVTAGNDLYQTLVTCPQLVWGKQPFAPTGYLF
ncbi:MAG: NAD(P)/FAD-dependent oxidoreductase [Leptolyngbyaceae cyanobacterium SM2_3_12]|nr:NAD(P)/FAD-dependent oxidoreductase [Leptolyngbyaceae cyanobacterium SM2_3_12]